MSSLVKALIFTAFARLVEIFVSFCSKVCGMAAQSKVSPYKEPDLFAKGKTWSRWGSEKRISKYSFRAESGRSR